MRNYNNLYHFETMDYSHISDLNSFQAFIFWFFGAIGVAIYKFLSYIMPKTAAILKDYYINEFTKDIKNDLEELNKRLENYKTKKHSTEGELATIKRVILDNDEEMLKELRELIKNENKQP